MPLGLGITVELRPKRLQPGQPLGLNVEESLGLPVIRNRFGKVGQKPQVPAALQRLLGHEPEFGDGLRRGKAP